jgi:hypothetical protein
MQKKKHPYEGTQIAPEKSQVEITKLLKEFGCTGIRWTDMVGELPLLEFIYKIEIGMRLLYWHIKSELEAVAYGLKTFEQVFLSEIIMSLPDGSTATFGEAVKDIITKGESPTFEKLGERRVMLAGSVK